MIVKDLLIKELKKIGADGLCNSRIGCGCGIDDLQPCCSWCMKCEPAKLKTSDNEERNYYVFTTEMLE